MGGWFAYKYNYDAFAGIVKDENFQSVYNRFVREWAARIWDRTEWELNNMDTEAIVQYKKIQSA